MSPTNKKTKQDGLRQKATAETETKTTKARRTGGGDLAMTRTELSRSCGWSTRTTDRLVKARLIPVIRVGKMCRFRKDAVLDALEKNSTVEAR